MKGGVDYRSLILPELGLDGSVPVRLSLWLVRPDEQVEVDQSLAEIVAGEIVVDLPSPVDGVLVERFVDEDQPITIGQALGRIKVVEVVEDGE